MYKVFLNTVVKKLCLACQNCYPNNLLHEEICLAISSWIHFSLTWSCKMSPLREKCLPPAWFIFIFMAITVTMELSFKLLLLLSLLLLLLLLLLLFELLMMLMRSWTVRMMLDIMPNTPMSAPLLPPLPQNLSALPVSISMIPALTDNCTVKCHLGCTNVEVSLHTSIVTVKEMCGDATYTQQPWGR